MALLATVRPAVVLRIGIEPVPTRLWTGSHPRRLPADDVETEGGEYLGLGLTEFPILDRLLDGKAGEYTFALPGISEELLALIDAPHTFAGAPVDLGQFKFNEAWQPIGAVEWIASYEAETVGFLSTTDEDGVRSATVVMTVGSAYTDRRRPRLVHWSEVENREVDPTDLAYQHVNKIAAGTRRKYPA